MNKFSDKYTQRAHLEYFKKKEINNKFRLTSLLKPAYSPLKDIQVCVVYVIRDFGIDSIDDYQTPTFMKWAETVKVYLQNLPEKSRHVILDDYSPGTKNILKKSTKKDKKT